MCGHNGSSSLPGAEIGPGASLARPGGTDQLAVLGVDVFDEIAVLSDPPDVLQAGAAVVDEDVPALVGVHHELLAVAFEHHELTDRAVEVPGVVRQLLMIELQLAGIDIKTNYRGRIKIVAGASALRLVVAARPIVERRRVGG